MKLRSTIVGLFALTLILTDLILPVEAAPIPSTKPDKALLVLYRLRKAEGSAIHLETPDSSAKSLGNLSNGSMIHEYLEPGQYTFRARSPSVDGSDSVTLDVAAGEAYYIQGEILWGLPAGRPKFSQKPQSQALADIQKL